MTDSIDLNRELIRHLATTFYARASGDSMKDCGIDDGDLLVIDKALEPLDGDIVVAFIDGEFTPELTQYLIDEAFLDFFGFEEGEKLVSYGHKIVKTIGKCTGIPVTMDKDSDKGGKSLRKEIQGISECICMIDSEEKRIKALQCFDIDDVWGIGHRSLDKLHYYGINTAWNFTQKSESFVRKLFAITGVRTWKELRSESCIDVEKLP